MNSIIKQSIQFDYVPIVAQEGRVPDKYIGARYADLSLPQLRHIREYRFRTGRCEYCGDDRAHRYCTANAQSTHAQNGEAPEELIGVAYKDMSRDQRRQTYLFRMDNSRCVACGGAHVLTNCKTAWKIISVDQDTENRGPCYFCGGEYHFTIDCHRFERAGGNHAQAQLAAMATTSSQQEVFKCLEAPKKDVTIAIYQPPSTVIPELKSTVSTGLKPHLLQIPTELRLKIFEHALRSDVEVCVRPDMFSDAFSLIPGASKDEIIEAFLRENVLRVDNMFTSQQFSRYLNGLCLFHHVQTLHFTAFSKFELGPSFRANSSVREPDLHLMLQCSQLKKIKFTIDAFTMNKWVRPASSALATDDTIVELQLATYAKDLGLDCVTRLKKLKAVTFRGWKSTMGVKAVEQDLKVLVEWMKQQCKEAKMEHVYVGSYVQVKDTKGDPKWDSY